MNNNRFLFVDIVSTLFQIILFVGNFLGFLYIFDGNIAFSITGAALLSILYFFLIQLLVDNKELMLKNKFKHGSSLFWVFYLVLAFCSFYLFKHFINVEYNAKQIVQQTAQKKLDVVTEAIGIYDERASKALAQYETEFKRNLEQWSSHGDYNAQKALLEAPFHIEKTAINGRGFDVAKLIESHLTPIQLRIETSINQLDSVFNENNKKYISVFSNWKRLSVVQTYVNLNQYVEKSTTRINDMIKSLPYDNEPVVFEYDKKNIPLSNPSALAKMYPPNVIIPFIAIVIIHFFLLIPFISQQVRVYKSPSSASAGVKPTRRKSKDVEQDLDMNYASEEEVTHVPSSNTGGTIEL